MAAALVARALRSSCSACPRSELRSCLRALTTTRMLTETAGVRMEAYDEEREARSAWRRRREQAAAGVAGAATAGRGWSAPRGGLARSMRDSAALSDRRRMSCGMATSSSAGMPSSTREKVPQHRVVKVPRKIIVQRDGDGAVSVGDLSRLLGCDQHELLGVLEALGEEELMESGDGGGTFLVGQVAAELAASEMGVSLVFGDGGSTEEKEKLLRVRRPPVVVVMGHVDHGKTSLLDALRRTNMTDAEVGGITQHIGAFHVNLQDFIQAPAAKASVPAAAAAAAGASGARRSATKQGKEKIKKGRGDDGKRGANGAANGSSVTFLDTPGHAAFSAMRARGTVAGDIGVLCVALDDGVMPQTREAYGHLREAGLPFVVAITKSDKFDPDDGSREVARSRVLSQLFELGVQCDEMGGDVPCVSVGVPPAQKGGAFGLYELVESITFLAELADITSLCPERYTASVASKKRKGSNASLLRSNGVVIESRLDKGRGPLATLLVKQGTLRSGTTILVGNEWGRVRSMRDWNGKIVQAAGASMPVEVDGLRGVVDTGCVWEEVENEKKARAQTRMRVEDVARARQREMESSDIGPVVSQSSSASPSTDGSGHEPSGEDSNALPRTGAADGAGAMQQQQQVVPVIIKADVLGTAEALRDALQSLNSEVVRLKVLHVGVGNITNSDVMLAATGEREGRHGDGSRAAIIGYNVKMGSASAQAMADRERVHVIQHAIIYEILEDVSRALRAAAPTREEEAVVGSGVVMKTFEIKRKQGMDASVMIAGSKVLSGRLLARTGQIGDPEDVQHSGVDRRRLSKDFRQLFYRKYRVLRETSSGGRTSQKKAKGAAGRAADAFVATGAEEVVFEGMCASIRHHQNVVDAAGKGSECGIVFENFNDFAVNDKIECVEVYKVPPDVEDVPGGGFRVVADGAGATQSASK